MSRILVTPRSISESGHPALQRLQAAGFEVIMPFPGRQPEEKEIEAPLADCVGYLAGVERIGGIALRRANRLKVISRNGIGIDNISRYETEKRGIKVRVAAGANARGVAELAWGLILGLVRSIPAVDHALKEGQWSRRKGAELEGKTLGVVGCGRIGKIVTHFALAFGMKVLGHDPYPDENFSPGPDFQYSPMETLIKNSDIITFHCGSQGDGQPLLDRNTLSRLRAGCWVINTSRSDLIDAEAMREALDSGQVAGLGLDVFRQEPPGDDPLVKHPAVIATAHIGGYTMASIDRAVEAAVSNLLEELSP